MSEGATKKDIEELAELINSGFTNAQEHVDKRFEHVDKRFEKVEGEMRDMKTELKQEISKLRNETSRRDDHLADEQQQQRERIEIIENKLDVPHPEKQHV